MNRLMTGILAALVVVGTSAAPSQAQVVVVPQQQYLVAPGVPYSSYYVPYTTSYYSQPLTYVQPLNYGYSIVPTYVPYAPRYYSVPQVYNVGTRYTIINPSTSSRVSFSTPFYTGTSYTSPTFRVRPYVQPVYRGW